MKFGINLGFANNRYPEPEIWTEIVKEIGLSDVQFVADILNPSLKKWDRSYYDSLVDRTVHSMHENGITVSSMMTSTFTRVNHFAHPDAGYRKIWLDWFKEFVLMGEKFGSKKLGSHLGIMTVNSERNDQNKIYDQTISLWAELSKFAYDYGYECLFFEPMSVNREFCDTIEKTLKTYEDLNQISKIPIKVCLDIGHAPHPTERDPYKWIEALASKSCIIHLQQTTKNNSNHSPFTEKFNKTGIIDGAKTINLLKDNGFDGDMIFEIGFKEKFENEPIVIDSLKESVEYWKSAVLKV